MFFIFVSNVNHFIANPVTMKSTIVLFSVLFILFVSCDKKSSSKEREIISNEHQVPKQVEKSNGDLVTKKVYVPVYSNIYQRTRNDRTQLTSTLSIHNTSETDTLFISRIDYFNTEGKFVRSYIKSPIYLSTFETLEYVVDEEDVSGGSGANFVVEWYGNTKLNPLFQAVMIGGLGSKSFSFVTEGVYFE